MGPLNLPEWTSSTICSTKDGHLNDVLNLVVAKALLDTVGMDGSTVQGVHTHVGGPLRCQTKSGAGREEESAGKRSLTIVRESPG